MDFVWHISLPEISDLTFMPILDARTVEFFTRGPEQTRRLGMRLGTLLQRGDVICLSGDLGSGKTTFVQGIARGWGSLDNVTSPTFILVNAYRRPDGQILHHLDAYRMQSALEAEDLDIDLMLEQGPLVLEWPERIIAAVPENRLTFNLRWMAEDQRGMTVLAHGTRYENLLAQLRRKIYGGS
jgi:tRNA threonylcarbamoyladenosine biosynthesis protein TsaE